MINMEFITSLLHETRKVIAPQRGPLNAIIAAIGEVLKLAI